MVRTAITMMVVTALLFVQTGQAQAAQLPDPVSSLFLQTSGPNAGLNIGDYYTSPSGGDTDHLFIVRVPGDWPAGTTVTVALYDPELAGPNPSSPSAADEVRGAADTATFRLESPSGSTIATTSYTDTSTNGTWVALATFDPGVTGTGTYELHVEVSDNDDNSWRVDASHDPDCAVGGPGTCDSSLLASGNESDAAPGGSGSLGLGVVRTSYQHEGSGLICQDHIFYVNPTTPRPLLAHNFDMDGNGSVTYTTPIGTTEPGTVSGNQSWNGSSDATRFGDELSDINGWWEATICISSHNQYVFEAPSAGPSFPDPQPTPRLTLSKDDGVEVAQVGSDLTYTITAENVSDTDPNPGEAHEVTITDTLPEGTSFVGCAAPPDVTCVESSGTMTITTDYPLEPGQSISVDVTVTVGPEVADTLVNTAGLTYEDHLGNDFPSESAADTNSVEFLPLLEIAVAGPDQVLRGDSLTHTYSVGHAPASDGSPVDAVVFSCDVCAGTTFGDGDSDGDGILDDGEIWTFEGPIDTGTGDPDPLTAIATVSGSDGNGDAVEASLAHDIDIIEPASIAGSVFEDLNGDGTRGAGEPGIDAIPVTLSDDSGPVAATATTGGDFAFTHLNPSGYHVAADDSALPEGMVTTGIGTLPTDLAEGEAVIGVDFGYAYPISIAGSVFHDSDLDSTRDGDETGLSGVTVSLIDESSSVVDSSEVAADGSFEFTATPGSYSLQVVGGLPIGWALTTPGLIQVGPLNSGSASTGNDFGAANQPPVPDVAPQTIDVGESPEALVATDPEGLDVEFRIVEGTLPVGVGLLPDGIFNSEAEVAGLYPLTIEVCDHGEPAACTQFQFELTVVTPEVEDLELLPFTGADLERLLAIGLVLVATGSGLVIRYGREEESAG